MNSSSNKNPKAIASIVADTPGLAPALIDTSSQLNDELVQQQGGLNVQMFDVLCLANVVGLRDAASYLATRFVQASADYVQFDHVIAQQQMGTLAQLATKIGCYDAADWLRTQSQLTYS